MTSELKPCPFCGGKGAVNQYTDGSFSVTCVNDCAHIDTKNKAELLKSIAAWNTRAVPDVPELVRYTLTHDYDDGTNLYTNDGNIRAEEGDYVLHSQAAAIIAAKDERLRGTIEALHAEIDLRIEAVLHAEAAEAKLARYEDQKPVAWHTRNKEGQLYSVHLTEYEAKASFLSNAFPLYASPAPLQEGGRIEQS